MKAIKITTKNMLSVVTVPELTWKGLGQLVGGHFETVRPWGFMNLNVPFKENLCMIVNEEGRCIGLDLNEVGSILYNEIPLPGFEPIVGDILIMSEGFENGEPSIIGLNDELVQALIQELINKFDFLNMELIEE